MHPLRFLYIYPHPDDESFGPGAAMAHQLRRGDEVYLLVLTRGGATKVRHRLGLSVDEMGTVRTREMRAMAESYGLTDLTVLDYPDSGLKELDPRVLERAVAEHIRKVRPHVLVTHPAHGISGFEDHLVAHAVVKRVYCELRDGASGDESPRRLAFTTLADRPCDGREPERPIRLRTARENEIDCTVSVTAQDLESQRRALACYETYQDTIAEMDPVSLYENSGGGEMHFEIFQEHHDPRLTGLGEGL